MVFVIHKDLHDEFTLQTLSGLFSCIIKTVPVPSEISTPLDGSYIVLQKRPSGKVVQTVIIFFLPFLTDNQKEHYTVKESRELNILSNKQVEKIKSEVEQEEVVIQQKVLDVGCL